MNIITIVLAIVGIAAALFVPLIFQFKGQPSIYDQVGSQLNNIRNVSIKNETLKIPQNETFDFTQWIQEIPWTDIWKAITDGVIGVVSWLSKGLVGILNIIIGRLIPNFHLPNWFGVIAVVFVLGMVLAKSLGGVADFSFTSYMAIMVILFIAIIIAIAFIYLGVLK